MIVIIKTLKGLIYRGDGSLLDRFPPHTLFKIHSTEEDMKLGIFTLEEVVEK